MRKTDVAIIGAGPYGLSIAAHLKAHGRSFRILGSPMGFWLDHMPKGMRLKSEGFASSLSDPNGEFTLEQYCAQKGIPYAKTGLPVAIETFTSYGSEFQKRFVPELEEKRVTCVRRSANGYEVCLEDGEVFSAGKVVVAVGLTYYDHLPQVLGGFSEEFVTHSSKHSAVERFADRDVIVVGAGASALDLAALLHQAGSRVQLVARKSSIRFHDPAPNPRPLMQRLRFPMTGIGPSWPFVFYTSAPLVFRKMPLQFRLDAVKRVLGPAPGWFVKDQVVGKVPFNLGMTITQANVEKGRVTLQLRDGHGVHKVLQADHLIAATGYKVDLRRLTFLDAGIQAAIQSVEQTPVLSSNFESSLPGLYFVGISAANTFGPLLRFAFGTEFTARRLSRHLAKSASANLVRSALKVQALDRS